MAGYGNINAPNLNPADHTDAHNNTRLGGSDPHAPYSGGHDTYGSGTTGGAGFGNKTAPDPENVSTSDLKLSGTDSTAPYTGAARHGSGSVGGAGYGNKTGSFGDSHDSTLGKVIEKVGHVMHNENLVEKGHTKRVEKGLGKEDES